MTESGTEYDQSGSEFEDDLAPVVKKPAPAQKKAPGKPRATAASQKKAPVRVDSEDDVEDEEEPVKVLAPLDIQSKSTANKPASGKARTIEEIYQKKSQLEHILLRPDTYIGSVEPTKTPMWVFEEGQMRFRNITYVPGLYKIFDEILVNAADNKVRDPTMDMIKVTIDRQKSIISVMNTGKGIPIEIHAEEKVYVPELIFGHLLTSSNYDDSEKKVTGGRNGYGAKLCNIFSTEFIVETAESQSKHKFKQIFRNNMSWKSDPDITDNKKGEDYTKIAFKPDLEKFQMTEFDDDLEALLKKRVYDMAGCVPGVKVFLNNERIKINNFKQYVDLYLGGAAEKGPIIYERVNDRWEVAFTLSDGQFQQVSFVNSICTSKGGTHTNHVADGFVTKLIEAVQKKDKKMEKIKPHQAKNHMWLFVNCMIENPAFDSQTKENMTLKVSAFGSKCNPSEDFFKKVLKSGVVDNILTMARFKSEQSLKKTDGSKRQRISGITKLDDANNAGTRNARNCTLILTEGDSAKALAVSGLSVVGRDNFGVFPLRGKLLNVREANTATISNNAEISAIKQILGLKQGMVYSSVDGLRYGSLMIMTDQDHDGSHIKGLIINFLDHFWPSLLKIPGFLVEFITPIVKATKGKDRNKQEVIFYTIPEYEKWKEQTKDAKVWTIKYYKGLGTSTTDDAKRYFAAMDRHRKKFKPATEIDRELVDMAFNKKKADDRKEWLRAFQPGTYMDHGVEEIPIKDFINKELILFSMADNARSIPSVVDGLKPGQRKIIFACFKRNLKNEIKVAQLSGYVSEHTAYHHGEQSLSSTIVGLAQNYVGSNNLNLLEPRGQFGTRLQGGKDAASARYIFTALSPITRILLNGSDNKLLNYLNEDGQSIEPEWYIPIIPMVLVNGSNGIGTGWSTSVPNYNPRDLVENIKLLMEGEEPLPMSPWYRGFKGTIERETKDKYKVSGIIEKIDETTVEITELPLDTWTQDYKNQLESWMVDSEKQKAWIKDYKEYHTDSSVHFVVSLTPECMEKAESEGLEKKFKITTSITTSNMVCFDKNGRIRKFESVDEIIKDFYQLRLEYYHKRKEYMLKALDEELRRLENKVRFVLEIIKGTLVVQNRKRADLIVELRARKYEPFPRKKQADDVEVQPNDQENEEEEGSHNDYDYLLSMPIWNLTMEKVQKLQNERDQKEEEVTALAKKSATDLWKADLDAFLLEWNKFELQMEKSDAQRPNNSTTANGSKRAAPKAVKHKVVIDDENDENDEVKPKGECYYMFNGQQC
ncbi:DNA topoisomerase [Cladochytrium replicatum]|nr:DNA topoisomerase [Cladochytrium replicatum]